MTDRFRVLLVEDHPLVREAVRRVLHGGELEVVGEASRLHEVLPKAKELRPDIVVLDIDLAGESAVGVIPQLVRQVPGASVVVLTAHTSDRLLGEVVEAGARGFLSKDMERAELRTAVIGAGRGELAMTRRRARIAMDHLARLRAGPAPDESGLTEREAEVLRFVAEGATDREIADSLVVSVRTVESHVTNVLRKMGVRNRTEAAARYRADRGMEPGAPSNGGAFGR
jgi:DNA-binding NarL/FixJ family response regulator